MCVTLRHYDERKIVVGVINYKSVIDFECNYLKGRGGNGIKAVKFDIN